MRRRVSGLFLYKVKGQPTCKYEHIDIVGEKAGSGEIPLQKHLKAYLKF
jgi:hypothetical protein